MVIREGEIKVYQKIGVDEETYKILRKEKKEQKKSMMRIVKELVDKNFKK